MSTMPFLISVPHGGTATPEEVAGRINIRREHVLEDGDAFTQEIYDLADDVDCLVKAEIARAFVDLNRAEDDLPPANPDGVVKSMTCYSRPIYLPGREPDESLIETLLARYHRPYHRSIRENLSAPNAGIVLALDCHSMAAVAPDVAPDAGQRRPVFCLGNRHGDACSMGTTRILADSLLQEFDLDEWDVTLNTPFAGGYVTRNYGGAPLPWIQVEMSRELFLRPPYFDQRTWKIDENRLQEIRARFRNALRRFWGRLQEETGQREVAP